MERCGERDQKSKLLKEKVFLIKVEGFLVLSSCVCQFCQKGVCHFLSFVPHGGCGHTVRDKEFIFWVPGYFGA